MYKLIVQLNSGETKEEKQLRMCIYGIKLSMVYWSGFAYVYMKYGFSFFSEIVMFLKKKTLKKISKYALHYLYHLRRSSEHRLDVSVRRDFKRGLCALFSMSV